MQRNPILERVQRKWIEQLAREGESAEMRRLGYAAWITANTNADNAYAAAVQSKDSLQEFLEAVPQVADDKIRGRLYDKLQPLLASQSAG